ncbi:Protein of unknown function [Bacillus mycoides]|uniref:Uncharacterized protein n=1 Tax=Bacillus mycoides TaxID=1405 RepID=A0A1G4EX85_BACMY|nr:Protein of unknown function [Bacillus mycoides]
MDVELLTHGWEVERPLERAINNN